MLGSGDGAAAAAFQNPKINHVQMLKSETPTFSYRCCTLFYDRSKYIK